MKKLIYLGLSFISVFTLSSCKLFSYELNLNYEERMAYSLYSASSMLTTIDNLNINELGYELPLQIPVDDPKEDYLIGQLDHYYTMFNQYLGKTEKNLASIEKDIELIDGYLHSFNFVVDTINYHIVYNELDVTVTDEVGNIEGLMYVSTDNAIITLDIEGAISTKNNKDNIFIKALLDDDYVKISFEDGVNGYSYKYNTSFDGINSSMLVKTMDYYNRSGFEVIEYVNDIKNSYRFMSITDDGQEKHKAMYDVEGEKGSITITIEPDDIIIYDIYEGKRRGHQHIVDDKRNYLFKE